MAAAGRAGRGAREGFPVSERRRDEPGDPERKPLTEIEGGEPQRSDRVLSPERFPMGYEMVERGPLAAAVGRAASERASERGSGRVSERSSELGASRSVGRLGNAFARDARDREEIEDPDSDLVTRWQSGDAGAFEQLVRRHEKKVFRLLLRMMGSREEAQDVAQETFLSLHRHGHRFRGDARFSTFIYRVASNAALNRRRTLGRNRARIQKLAVRQAAGDDLPSSPRNPEDAVIGGDLSGQVRRALDGLKPALRLPVVLYDIEGLPYGEIAAVLGVAEGTVKSRIHRARQALRAELQSLLGDAADASDNTPSSTEADSGANSGANSGRAKP